jgi:photosystem II stability/assembly factor-like uncharacterized protein
MDTCSLIVLTVLFYKSNTGIVLNETAQFPIKSLTRKIMKLIFTLVSVVFFSTSFSQWTKVEHLASSDIASLYHKDSTLYAGGRNIIYISKDNGKTWDSTSTIPQLFLVTSITVYKDELYAAAPHQGVFKSPDDGRTWQNISAGIFPDVSDFCEFRGDLYAPTLGSSVFRLDPVTRDHWLSFSNGLSSLSANITTISANDNAMVAGTLANGLYDYLPANSTTWEERFLRGRITPTEGVYDIINSHDSLFLTGHIGRVYMSTDNGLNWTVIGDVLPSLNSTLVNAREAVLLSVVGFDGTDNITVFYYIKKDSLQNPFVQFSFALRHFTYKMDIIGNKLWDASNKGLFYMSLSDLPGITCADSVTLTSLPVRFTLFNAKCDNKKVSLTWKTAQEQNSSHFDIEKSEDGIHWNVISTFPAAGTSNSERDYSFTDNDPVQNNYYRIAEYDLDGRSQFTSIVQATCNATNTFNLWPNPVHDKAFITITADNASQVMIKIFDSKGSLVKMQSAMVLQGGNQLNVDMKPLASGVYSVSIDWNNGQMKKTVQVWKQ